MVLLSLKDYAKKHNISYEAVRQQVNRYQDELNGHIVKDGRQQFLDEEAVSFLDARRLKNPVAIIQQDKDERLEEMRRQNEELLIKIAAQADKISEMAQWKADNALLIAEAAQAPKLLEAAEEEKARLRAEASELRQEASEAKTEARTLAEENALLKSENEGLKARKLWDYLFPKK